MDFNNLSINLNRIDNISDETSNKAAFIDYISHEFPWPARKRKDHFSYEELFVSKNEDDIITMLGQELISTIYLCLGRISQNHRKQLSEYQRSFEEIVNRFQQIPITNSNVSTWDVFVSLSQSSNDIEYWLRAKGKIPDSLQRLVSKISTYVGRERIAKILVGYSYDESWIIKYLSTHPSSGTRAVKVIQKTLKRTWTDIGYIAFTLWFGGKDGYGEVEMPSPKPGLPIIPPTKNMGKIYSIEKAWNIIGPCYVDPKLWDGWQVQIHINNNQVWIFNREQENINKYFPSIVENCQRTFINQTVIFDGEILGVDPITQKIYPLEETITAPYHRTFLYDILCIGGDDLRNKSYRRRREVLRNLLSIDYSSAITLLDEVYVKSKQKLFDYFDLCLQNDLFEGIVAKQIDAPYYFTKSSPAKWKIKNNISIDAIILGYRISPNKIPIFLVGVWDLKQELIIPIGEALGTQIKFEKANKILEICKEHRLSSIPDNISRCIAPKNWVKPSLVIEIHTNGKRIADERFFNSDNSRLSETRRFRLRPDKSIYEANTLEHYFNLKILPK